MKYLKIIMLSIIVILLTGCQTNIKSDKKNILTTTYSLVYLTKELYKDNATVTSIYPNGINTDEYELTDKQLNTFSKNDMFIYNGLSKKEKSLATTLLNKNSNIKLLDVSQGITIENDIEELWLSPSNYLMLAKNITKGLSNYISSTIEKNEINSNYENFKLKVSKYDADLKNIAEHANNKDIIVGNDVFKFLNKYGFNILSLEENQSFLKADMTKAKNEIQNKTNSIIFVLDTDNTEKNVEELVSLGAKKVIVRGMKNLSLSDEKNSVTYETMMNEFIEELRNEAYN